jgi:hypothetical protein
MDARRRQAPRLDISCCQSAQLTAGDDFLKIPPKASNSLIQSTRARHHAAFGGMAGMSRSPCGGRMFTGCPRAWAYALAHVARHVALSRDSLDERARSPDRSPDVHKMYGRSRQSVRENDRRTQRRARPRSSSSRPIVPHRCLLAVLEHGRMAVRVPGGMPARGQRRESASGYTGHARMPGCRAGRALHPRCGLLFQHWGPSLSAADIHDPAPRIGHRAVSRFRTNPGRWDIRCDDPGTPLCGGSRKDD